jgi:hypothetical protein
MIGLRFGDFTAALLAGSAADTATAAGPFMVHKEDIIFSL